MTCEPLSRQQWMRLLALAPPAELDALLSPLLPDADACRWLRRPETGLAMLQGRAGGTGARFNLGEASLTRASVNVGAFTGHAWVLGSQPRHAELAALADALLQDPARHDALAGQVLTPLNAALAARRAAERREAAASKVEFFTMVRGE